MRVLVTLDAVGGVWQYGIDLASALAECRVQTILAVLGPSPSAEQRREAAAVPDAMLIETGLPLDWMCDGPDQILDAGETIAKMAADAQVDLVQLNMPSLAAGTRPTVPTIAVTHGCVVTWWEASRPGVPLDPAYAWHRQLTECGLRAVDRVVAPTASHADCVQRQYHLPSRPAVVHNGRAPLAPVPNGPPQDRALTVGRLWDSAKRAELLDRVAAGLPFPFHAAGPVEGPHGERVTLDHLILLGNLDAGALASCLARRPVFVSAASFEPFGLAVLEAANAGCALVLSDIPTFRELWDGAAVFVADDDPLRWASAIERVIRDAGRRDRLGQAARKCTEGYAPSAMATGMIKIFDAALEGNGRRGRAAA